MSPKKIPLNDLLWVNIDIEPGWSISPQQCRISGVRKGGVRLTSHILCIDVKHEKIIQRMHCMFFASKNLAVVSIFFYFHPYLGK